MLEKDRHLEFHARYGHYFRMRIPKHGRDMALAQESSDLYVVGSRSVSKFDIQIIKFML